MVSHKLRIKSIHWENIRNYEWLPNDNIGSDRMGRREASHLIANSEQLWETTTMHLLRSTFTGIPILTFGGIQLQAKHNRVGQSGKDWYVQGLFFR